MRAPDIALVGTGAMGLGMGRRLLEAGRSLCVHNRTRVKIVELVEAGASPAKSPKEIARAPVVLLSLSDEGAVEDVLFHGLLPELSPGTVVIDTTTTSPTSARRSAERLAEAGLSRVEACVLGNPDMARNGKLRVFTAGDTEEVEGVGEILDTLAQERRHLGGAGTATSMKLAFNLLLGVQTVGFAEAVNYGEQAGLDRQVVIDAITGSGFSSPVLSYRAGFMHNGCYEPAAFKAELMEKDLRSVVEDAEANGLLLPLAERARERMTDVGAAGLSERDAAVIVEVPERVGPGTKEKEDEG